MITTAVYTKAPQAVLQFEIDWQNVKPVGQAIASSDWTLSTGLTQVSKSISGDITAIILSGGEAGSVYTAVNTITYNDGQIDQRTLTIRVEKRRKTFIKRAAASLDYWIDYSGSKPSGLTIQTSTWTIDDGLTNEDDGTVSADDTVYVVLSGGVAGSVYEALNVVTYSDGVQKDARIVEIRII